MAAPRRYHVADEETAEDSDDDDVGAPEGAAPAAPSEEEDDEEEAGAAAPLAPAKAGKKAPAKFHWSKEELYCQADVELLSLVRARRGARLLFLCGAGGALRGCCGCGAAPLQRRRAATRCERTRLAAPGRARASAHGGGVRARCARGTSEQRGAAAALRVPARTEPRPCGTASAVCAPQRARACRPSRRARAARTACCCAFPVQRNATRSLSPAMH